MTDSRSIHSFCSFVDGLSQIVATENVDYKADRVVKTNGALYWQTTRSSEFPLHWAAPHPIFVDLAHAILKVACVSFIYHSLFTWEAWPMFMSHWSGEDHPKSWNSFSQLSLACWALPQTNFCMTTKLESGVLERKRCKNCKSDPRLALPHWTMPSKDSLRRLRSIRCARRRSYPPTSEPKPPDRNPTSASVTSLWHRESMLCLMLSRLNDLQGQECRSSQRAVDCLAPRTSPMRW